MEQLQARIKIRHVEGAEIAYLYHREAFDLLGITPNEEGSKFIEVGHKFMLDGVEYEVKKINFKMESQMHDMGHGYGINLYSPTDPADFNCQIGVFVDTK